MPKTGMRSPVFPMLCDIANGNSLVAMTGAGISSRLVARYGPGTLPGWYELIERLLHRFRAKLPIEDARDCDSILQEGTKAPGSRLIEAASLLRKSCGARFDAAVRRENTPRVGQTSPTHRALLGLHPRGIITFNYDDAHENAAVGFRSKFRLLLPAQEHAIRLALRQKLEGPFLLKAHGSIHGRAPLVLTYETYRDLLIRQPAYRAFLQAILTNYHLLIVGFGLADPDFDLFLNTIASTFGSPLQGHVVITHVDNSLPGREVELRRRYGIHTLLVKDFGEIPTLIDKAAKTAGPRLRSLLTQAIKGSLGERSRAHAGLRRLGPAGKECAQAWLRGRLGNERGVHYRSELAYSLGVLDASGNKGELMSIVESSRHSAPVARALTVLRPVLRPGDMKQIRGWTKKFQAKPLRGDPKNRLAAYCGYLEIYVPSKDQSDRTRPRGKAVPKP